MLSEKGVTHILIVGSIALYTADGKTVEWGMCVRLQSDCIYELIIRMHLTFTDGKTTDGDALMRPCPQQIKCIQDF